jgi:hypothetical protein
MAGLVLRRLWAGRVGSVTKGGGHPLRVFSSASAGEAPPNEVRWFGVRGSSLNRNPYTVALSLCRTVAGPFEKHSKGCTRGNGLH